MQNIHHLEMDINRQPENQIYEFENLEELRQFDPRYQTRSDNKALELVSTVFQIPESDIHNIRCLKSGMTNKSFLFQVGERHYICRIPGPGSELLVNRRQEAAVYEAIRDLGISEHVVYLDSRTGYKISEYYEGSHNARANHPEEIKACMAILRKLHGSGLTVNHSFDIRERIDFYERLCMAGKGTLFEDYDSVREKMERLMNRLEHLNRPKTLSHIDSNPDNFICLPDGSVRLIDWEYAGMCDPLIDISMCAIYAYYTEEQMNQLAKLYLERPADDEERMVIYSYAALGGFLWALWAVYKASLGEEFGEYTLIMYRYAKDYYKKADILWKQLFSSKENPDSI